MTYARGFVLPAVLLAVAIVVGMFALDVHRWDRALADGDALYATAPVAATWRAPSRVPGALAERALGLSDDLALRRALQRYRRTAARRARLDNAVEVAADRAETETALAAVVQGGDPKKAAQAGTLLGVLTFADFARGGDSAGQADAAVAYLDAAVRADPTNEAAKFDLELALRALSARGVRVGPGSGTGTGSTGRRGAGGGAPGSGY